MSYLNHVFVGDCFKVLPKLPPDSVDLCVTSPPFWGLRSYGDNCVQIFGGDSLCQHEWIDTPPPRTRSEGDTINPDSKQNTVRGSNYNQKNGGFCEKCRAWRGQLGLEPHPQMFIDHLIEFGRLVRRVLKPSGLFWLNLGDTYCTGAGKSISSGGDIDRGIEKIQPPSSPNRMVKLDGGWLQPKQLLMIPSRVACALQDDGWILRSDVIWYKPNHMPESVADRFTKSYEHFFMFSKEQRYYFNLDEVREVSTSIPWSIDAGKYKTNNPRTTYKGKFLSEDTSQYTSPRARVLDRETPNFYNPMGKNPGDVWEIPTQPFPGSHFAVFPEELVKRIIKCSSPPQGVVLDPFAGSGTVLRVARRLGRSFIGIELKPEYAEMAEQRIRGRNFRKKNVGVKPLEYTLTESEEL